MKRINKLLILFILVLIGSSFTHKYYISKTLIYYDKEASSIEITTQIFIDDIELEIFNIHGERMNLEEDNEHEDAEFWMKEYFRENLVITINSSQYILNYLGSEIEGEILYCYLEIPNITEISTLEIKNEILISTYDEQENIIDIEFPSWEKRVFLNKDKVSEIII